MAYDGLREFLAVLEGAGQLLRIPDQVRCEPDLGAAGRAVTYLGDATAPALLFTDVHGYDRAKVALNVHGSWANHALMLGMPPQTPVKAQSDEIVRRWSDYPIPVERRTAEPPWLANTVAENINVFELLPVFRLNTADGGPYIDKASVITRDPNDPDDFGKVNVGIYRIQVKGGDHLGFLPVGSHDAHRHLVAAEERGESLPVTIAIGNDPVLSLMASTPLGYDQSEYEMAGALRGEPFPTAVAPYTGLEVPWGAEIVIEGEVPPGIREFEGPFGEFTGHYSGGQAAPVITVRRVHHRDDPIYEHLYLGIPWTETDHILALNTSVPLQEQLKAAFPEVVAVNAMYTHGLLAIISTKVRHGEFGRVVGLRALTTPHGIGYCKIVIVVDDYVDPFNLPQVMWAMTTKLNAEYDAITIPRMYEMPLDPSASPKGITTRLILDATTPVAPDARGEAAHLITPPAATAQWEQRLREMIK